MPWRTFMLVKITFLEQQTTKKHFLIKPSFRWFFYLRKTKKLSKKSLLNFLLSFFMFEQKQLKK